MVGSCFLRDLLLGAIVFHLVLCSVLMKTGIEFIYGNIDANSAMPIFPIVFLSIEISAMEEGEDGFLFFVLFL